MSSSRNQLGEQARRARGIRKRTVRLETLEERVLLSLDSAPYPLMSAAGANLLPSSNAEVPEIKYLPPSHTIRNLENFLTGPTSGAPLDIALGFMRSSAGSLSLSADDLANVSVTDLYTDSYTGTTHIYLRQMVNGLEVSNALASANVDAQGRMINVDSTFVSRLGQSVGYAQPNPGLSAGQALSIAAGQLGLTPANSPLVTSSLGGVNQKTILQAPGISLDEVPAKLQYVLTETGPQLAWNFIVRTPDGQHWYDLSVNANTASSIDTTDWVDHATYNVFALPAKSPTATQRTIVTNPQDSLASPYGWHDTDGTAGAEFTDTRGNNVSAQDDTDGDNAGGNRPDGGASLNFNFPLNLNQAPSAYQNAAITNLFYVTNALHDIHYHYGFDEVSGNFQINNYGRGGTGGDAVQTDAQDGSGIDNANFATPPDGFAPRMQMFLWDTTNPGRDGDLDNQVIIHEFGHGISNRLTGGPSNAGALNAIQSGGMGEGWSDWWSLMLTAKSTDTFMGAYPVGNYVLGLPQNGPGIRRFPYSYDMAIDPQTINDYNGGFPNWEVHNSGELWAGALWDMSQLLVQKYGFDANLYTGYTGAGSSGNQLAMRLVMDALKLQPANPTFKDARDALLQADLVLTGGGNRKEIWTAFARRGMGVSFDPGSSANSTKVIPAFDTPNFVVGVGTLTGQVGLATSFSNIPVAIYTEGTGEPAGSYTATINWGDNLSSPGTVTKVGSTVTVSGSHIYSIFGNFKMNVVLTNAGVWAETVTNPVIVTDAPVVATPIILNVNEGVNVSQAVASFTSGNPGAVASQYTATIRWGDNFTTPGSISINQSGGFDVQGNHTYRQAGSYDVTVTISSKGGTKTSVKSKINVADSPIDTSAVTFNATEAVPFTGTVASYIDHAPDGGLTFDWLATIDWGDQSTPTKGAIQAQGNGFVVVGTHEYARFGNYVTKVTLTNSTGTVTTQVDSTGSVADAAITGSAPAIKATVGTPFVGVLAIYNDVNPNGLAADLIANLDWGDGSTGTGTVTLVSPGKFSVTGTHTFTNAGSPAVFVKLESKGNAPIEPIQVPTTVSDAPLNLAFAGVAIGPANNPSASTPGLTVTLGQNFSGPLLNFTSTDPAATAGEYQVLINWGDGTQTTGTLSQTGSTTTTSSFVLDAQHAYASAGSFPLSVAITSKGGKVTTSNGFGHVLLPLNGQLDSASDTGVSSSDRITNLQKFLYRGTSEFNAGVALYARLADGSGSPTLIGQGTASGLGAWAINTTTALPDGKYILTAVSTDSAGNKIQTQDFGTAGAVTVDRSGPQVLSLQLNAAKGTATVIFADNDGSGLYANGLLNLNSYKLTLPGKRGTSAFPATSVTPVATLSGNGQQAVVVAFKTKGRLVNGSYVMTINSNVVSDVAGNALFDRTFVAFPQLSNTPNNTFIAQINVVKGMAQAPTPYVPIPEIIAAQNYSNTVKQGGTVKIRRVLRRG